MSSMLRKKEVYTHITPIPLHIPRQLAIDILHSHSEIITLNPLVLEHKPIKAPRDAKADEFYSTWYEITERIQYIPGAGKLGSGKISFKGCFHDMPWGLQTHILAPMNIDMRNNWRIAGSQPGEPPETKELGLGAPAEGLYLREDIEIKCNITLVSFVKGQMKAASKILVDRLIKKAELLDAGVLHAMMENGRLKTINPADRSSTMGLGSPTGQFASASGGRPTSPYTLPQRTSTLNDPHGRYSMPPKPYGQQEEHQQQVIMELPGDFVHPQHLQPPGSPNPGLGVNRYSSVSEHSQHSDYSPNSNQGRWSEYSQQTSSRPTSYASDGGLRSPGLDQKKNFAAELPATQETHEEHKHDPNRTAALKRLEARDSSIMPSPPPPREQHPAERYSSGSAGAPHDPPPRYRYNPQDYAELKPSAGGRQESGKPRVILP
jgi:hypothetical protein